MKFKIIYNNSWFSDQQSLNLESILMSKFDIFIYINLDKAKNYFSFIQIYVYKSMKFRHKNRFKIQTLLIDKPAYDEIVFSFSHHDFYGFYYNFWDKWMGTNHKKYYSTFEKITNVKSKNKNVIEMYPYTNTLKLYL